MKSTTAKLVFYSFVLIGILVLAPMGDTQDLCAATETVNLSVDQILDRVEKRYTNSKFSADFIQKSTLKAMDITDLATGKVYIKYPGMMRWEYEKPDRQIIVTDADRLWIYRPEDNQVMTGKAPTFFGDGKGASFLSDIRLIRQKFDISLEQGGQAENDLFYHLKLIPREKTLDISEIRLMVSRQTFNVLQVMTINFYGDETRIDLINFAFGVDLDDSLFSFTIPPGVDVLQINE
ncbi:MAG: outer membrane lipoprotein carrier protein LolA [Desulfobacterales bacterium]